MIKNILVVGTGGAMGTILRYLISVYTSKHYSGDFPIATFFINITGCMLIGLFVGLAERNQLMNGEMRLFLITGFCGGYTTFSTFSLENQQLMQQGNQFILYAYLLSSIIVGIAAVYIGGYLSRI
ncbi:fluoride efflux transporter CrcB [Apibacter raozihei]|uniref:fluoride efflux transporter CrcB n=1 Tax=Apibacter TaxID=1778601 RepID=UPI000FE35AA0|nr:MULTISPECIES: fluoride efflux transporter CrcB [Apibacter]